MAKELDVVGQQDPYFASKLKGYDVDEISSALAHLDSTIAWLVGKGLHLPTSEDIVTFRAGVPYLGGDKTVDADSIYDGDGNLDVLIRSISTDVIKVTLSNGDTTQSAANRMTSYTYKSKYVHRIFGRFFYDGVDNRTGFTYMDGENTNLSNIASVPVRYNGVVQNTPATHSAIPDFFIKCMTYLVQHPRIFVEMGNSLYTKGGDLVHFKSDKFYTGLVTARANLAEKIVPVSIVDLPINVEEAVADIFETTGLDNSFSDLEYGGLIDGLRLVIRIPASRAKQEILEGLLSTEEVFSDVFKEEWVTDLSIKDEEGSVRDLDLADPYNMDAGDLGLEDVANGYYGCRRVETIDDPRKPGTSIETITHRHWMVSDKWLSELTAEHLAVIFWEGLDILSNNTSPCPLDKIVTIIIIIVMTVISVISLGSTAALQAGETTVLVAQALAITSAVISIGMTTGAITTQQGGIAAAVVGAASLFTLNFTAILTTFGSESLQAVMAVASVGLQIAEVVQEDEFASSVKDLEDQQAEVDANNPEFFEEGIRIELGGYQDMHIQNGAEVDYEKYLTDTYSRFATYKHSGFRG